MKRLANEVVEMTETQKSVKFTEDTKDNEIPTPAVAFPHMIVHAYVFLKIISLKRTI